MVADHDHGHEHDGEGEDDFGGGDSILSTMLEIILSIKANIHMDIPPNG